MFTWLGTEPKRSAEGAVINLRVRFGWPRSSPRPLRGSVQQHLPETA
ncbi:hypothetical protein FHS35_008718 [Streptomyces umbrinus]|nr:hypothetical protein [Streptomyces umbrinus]